MIWLTTGVVLFLCLGSGGVGCLLVLAWSGVQLPGFLAVLSGGQILEPLGAGGLSLTAIAIAFGYGQMKAVFGYDLVWTRTVATSLLIASAALLIGAAVVGRTQIAVSLLLPAVGLCLLGLCMFVWLRKLRAARLQSPRPLVPPANDSSSL